jgi:isopentenyldiphosphate isomerase
MGHTPHPKILIVDENDQPIGAATKDKIWEKGLWHRIIRVMVEDNEGRILLQKRSTKLELSPGRWAESASGHADEGDDYNQAAKRELEEEIGLKDVTLEELGSWQSTGDFQGRILNRFNKAYRVNLNQPFEPVIQEKEVSEVRWFSLDELKDLIKNHPEKVTRGLVEVVGKYYSP